VGATAVARREVLEELRLIDLSEDAETDPKALINEIRFFDPSSEKWVEFRMFPPEGWEPPTSQLANGEYCFVDTGADDWFWQHLIIEWWNDPVIKKYLILKARQLGITLLACAYGLWILLYRPGSAVVAYSYTEDESKKLVEASWLMYLSLPEILRNRVEVVTPKRTDMPSEWIKFRHPDGRISTFQALPATKKHGHGSRVTFAIMDEVARQDYAKEIYTAINPAVNRGRAKLAMISTANGVSNRETGEGNFFHHLYATKKEKGLAFKFLPWNLEPTRDADWYQREAMALDDVERNQQYPLNENDAFMLSGALYFNRESLDFYRKEIVAPQFMGQFVVVGRRRARFMKLRDGIIEVYEKPRPDGKYAIGVDTATGRGSDYTSGDVIDLASGAIVAHLHAKIEAPRAAVQLHYLGKWYNEARICVERQGGYGEALIIALRDGNQNLPVYQNLYRHKKFTNPNKPIAGDYGHPMGEKARATVLDNLKGWIRLRQFPWLSSGHVDELGTFVYTDTKPSPRAQDGCNDDRVMSLALAVWMFGQYGQSPAKRKKWKKSKYQPPPTRSMR
jgi:hypothetical protein